MAEEDQSAGAAQQAAETARLHPHARGLRLVGIYKLTKAVFFSALGAGALNLIHRNLGELVLRVVDAVKIMNPEGHLVSMLMDRVDLIGGHQLRQASMAAFGYAFLCLIEGTGLMLEKVWAEYFTVVLTALALPWEIYELAVRYNIFKLTLLLLNLAVLLYLLWVLKKKRTELM